MRHSLRSALVIAGALVLVFNQTSCAAAKRTPIAPRGDASPAYTAFGFNLYHEILREKAGNVFISPASVGFALAMTYNGAGGGTAEAMASVLGYEGRSLSETNAADSTIIRKTNDEPEGIDLAVANSLWARKGIEFSKEFLARNKRSYGAEIKTLDFGDPRAAAEINGWVARNTRYKITQIVEQIDGQSILFLINAVYFKGLWSKEFDRGDTREEDFHLPRGEVKRHPLMRRSGDFRYLRGDDFQAASLPYADGRISMYVFLPDDVTGLDAFNAKLTAAAWSGWMKSFASRSGTVALPRFKMEFEMKLREALSALGMGVAFDGARADFTRMVKRAAQNVYIDNVTHKTYIDVNEKGTEAAAVTSVEMKLTSVMEPPKPFEMIVDHPFFFAIVDNETGLILFMGSIVDPQ